MNRSPAPAATQSSCAAVDLSEVAELLKTALDRIPRSDGRSVPAQLTGRDRSAELAGLTRDLLYLAHLCKKAETAAMDEYWVLKGQTEHLPREA